MTTAATDTNYQRVAEGLRTLTAELAPYVAQELRAACRTPRASVGCR